MRWRRSERIPDDARAALDLQRGERVLAAARSREGAWYAATPRALVGPDRRIDWVDVAHAQWADDVDTLSIDLVPPQAAPFLIALAEPGRLPETVRERVMASILLTRRVAVPGGSVNVVARDHGDGDVRWQEVPDPAVDLHSADVRAVLEARRPGLEGELGR